ncbi:hypothetical protein [Candidatus Odyssella thessalonicensis]|uniref:hypothetical protein n=1 Tax=Candidatus Odyssella thessalonicensis TaxID=84647 RepID=UPI000225AC56|nr:hypothetical protein [Candidatus Odyssella thessalonicensis]
MFKLTLNTYLLGLWASALSITPIQSSEKPEHGTSAGKRPLEELTVPSQSHAEESAAEPSTKKQKVEEEEAPEDFTSKLYEPQRSKQIKETIFEKAGPQADVSTLTWQEKEWLYETRRLSDIETIEKQGGGDEEDLSRILGELSNFYEYKGRGDLADEMLKKKADLDLRCALIGDEATLGIFNYMIRKGHLDDSFFREIIKYYREDPDLFVDGKYSYLIEDKDFHKHVLSLARGYKKSFPETQKNRQEANIPPIPLYDDPLQMELQERIERRNSQQSK